MEADPRHGLAGSSTSAFHRSFRAAFRGSYYHQFFVWWMLGGAKLFYHLTLVAPVSPVFVQTGTQTKNQSKNKNPLYFSELISREFSSEKEWIF
ncbi:hypothetical protein GYA13_03365 [Candidatus Kuenenbacteria bacterium]|nr:hypothetical protein [Candidatus Kuenenbacteria bacterium]